MAKLDELKPGDTVRVIMSGGGLGDTDYVVRTVNRFACTISEVRCGIYCGEQRFDVSLLQKV